MKADHNSTVSDSKITERLGGPFGQLANRGYTLLPPLYTLIILSAFTYAIGYFLDFSCIANGWADPQRYMHLCYSDIPPLYVDRGFAEGIIPYVQTGSNGIYLEYPVGTGIFMYIAAVITGWVVSLYPRRLPRLLRCQCRAAVHSLCHHGDRNSTHQTKRPVACSHDRVLHRP